LKILKISSGKVPVDVNEKPTAKGPLLMEKEWDVPCTWLRGWSLIHNSDCLEKKIGKEKEIRKS